MRRREFISLIGGGAVAWPLAARAQQSDRVRVIGSLNILAEDDPEAKLRITAQQLGWTEGSNVRIEARWAGGDDDRVRKYAEELAGTRARCRLELRQQRRDDYGAPCWVR